MATLTAEQIAGFAVGAGFKGSALETAVAVALAESSGRTDVVNAIGCVGLWQINQKVHVKAHPVWTVAALKDPSVNAQAAYELSKGGTNWTPWVAHSTGAYLLYLSKAKAGVKANGGASSSVVGNPDVAKEEITAGPLESIASLAQFPAKILAWISDRNNIFRIMKVTVGAALIIGGLVVLSKPVIEPVAGAAMKAL